MKGKDFIATLLSWGAVIFFTALLGVVLLQVFSRFLLPKAPSWTEEAARILFIFSIVCSAPVALKRNEYVSVDVILNRFKGRLKPLFEIMITLICMVLFFVVFDSGITFAQLGVGQTSPTLTMPMYIPYSSMAIAAAFMLIYLLVKLVKEIKRFIQGAV